jgi:hypothetical protein
MAKPEYEHKRRGDFLFPWILVATSAVIPALSACYVAIRDPIHEADGAYNRGQVYASEPAPPPRAEVVVGLAPSPDHVWVGSYWTRHHNDWYWVGGRWAARPHPGAIWVDGRWDSHPRGYVRIGGYWR